MKSNIIHSIVVCLTAFVLPLMVACGSQEESLPEATEAALYLEIEPMGQTRAGETELSENEKMKSVRVVVLHQDGTVEHNRSFSLGVAQAKQHILLKVKPKEKKKIFLFANEESVTAVEGVTAESETAGSETLTGFFEKYPVDTPGFEAAVNNLYFAPDYSEGKPIPMSSVYEINIPTTDDYDGTFYVVRVATKFTINFINWQGEEVKVKKFSIAKHADKNFLMAHVNDSEQNRHLFGAGKTWIDWLKTVSDYTTTETAGWLKDYKLPTQADRAKTYTHGAFTVGQATINKDNPENSSPGVAENVPVFYLPESMNPKTDATDGEQEYTLTIEIEGRDEPFSCALPNLKALFRNTHVVVNITMYHNFEISVDVIPFTGVDLKPDYGLEREEFTGYIVGEDKEKRKCWYDGNYYDKEEAVPLYLGPKVKNEEGKFEIKEGEFVEIKGKKYMLVYTNYERTAANLDHFFEESTHKKHLLTPQAITGYKIMKDHTGSDMYVNDLQQRVWLDLVTKYNWFHTINEWDRLEWNWAIYDGEAYYPRFWFDIFGNRYPWSEGDTEEKRKNKLIEQLGEEWIQYLK